MGFQQLKKEEWLHAVNKAVAVINYEPEELENKLRIKFNQSYDELDFFKIAVLQPISGNQFCLVRYRGNPSSGTEVWISKKVKDIAHEVNKVLKVLKLTKSDLKWEIESED